MTTREWYAADADDQDRTRSDTTVWRDRGAIIAAQQARIAELEAQIARHAEDAREDVEHWGSYAGDYFAEKWDLAGDIAKWEARRDA